MVIESVRDEKVQLEGDRLSRQLREVTLLLFVLTANDSGGGETKTKAVQAVGEERGQRVEQIYSGFYRFKTRPRDVHSEPLQASSLCNTVPSPVLRETEEHMTSRYKNAKNSEGTTRTPSKAREDVPRVSVSRRVGAEGGKRA